MAARLVMGLRMEHRALVCLMRMEDHKNMINKQFTSVNREMPLFELQCIIHCQLLFTDYALPEEQNKQSNKALHLGCCWMSWLTPLLSRYVQLQA